MRTGDILDITKYELFNCLDNNGCVFLRCNQENEHYVIITKRDKKYFYIFDPYYLDKDYYKKDKDIKIVLNKPFTYNRKVTINRVFSTKDDFSMGDVDKRECVLINRR